MERLYPDGHVAALIGIDVTIAAGEYIAVMGPSGSGKSTLLNLIGGLDKPTAGEILFEGISLAQPGAIDDIRINKIGFIFQAFHLLPTLSAAENVQIPMFESALNAAARRRRAGLLLAEVGMSHRMHHLPTQLSGGERQSDSHSPRLGQRSARFARRRADRKSRHRHRRRNSQTFRACTGSGI